MGNVVAILAEMLIVTSVLVAMGLLAMWVIRP
jgi:hypothetical protein